MLTRLKLGLQRTRVQGDMAIWLLPAFVLLIQLIVPMESQAATVWTGPLTTFTQAGVYPNPPGDRDQLTPHVALTRGTASGGGTGGMFNAVTETSFNKGLSPADTQWAVGSLSDYATLTYADWTTCGGGNPVHNLPGQQLVVHLISDDVYLSLKFTSLPSGPGFTYIRSTLGTANVPPSVTITNPVNGASFTAPATVSIQASASDTDGTVTNVQFFDGTTSLGNVAASPYSISVGLGVGSHILTAVASDNLGARTTSAAVAVTVDSVRLTAQVSGNQLNLSWPVAGWRLQGQTNSPGVGIGTNWVTVPGSTGTNHVVVPINPANGSVFFRLVIP